MKSISRAGLRRTRCFALNRLDVLLPQGRIVGIGDVLRYFSDRAVDNNRIDDVDTHGLSSVARPLAGFARHQAHAYADIEVMSF